MKIEDLVVTQNELRHTESLQDMIDHVRSGGRWNDSYLQLYARNKQCRVSPLIQISVFEDGVHYLHDGHHRTVCTYLGGRDVLFPHEYKITSWTYKQYAEVNIPVGWFTPFDPRTHCRKCDLAAYKSLVKSAASSYPEQLVRKNFDLYCEPRKYKTVVELAQLYSNLRTPVKIFS